MAPGQISTIEEIPYLDASQLKRCRYVPSLTFHVEGQWRIWLQTGGDNAFVEIQGEPAEAYYFASTPVHDADFTTFHINFIAQRALLHGLTRAFSAFKDDLFNLAASLAKLELIHASDSPARSRMACTEVEYILTVCRSMYDLLQEMLACLWENVRLTDSKAKKKSLKRSFAEMALKGQSARSTEELASIYGLPVEVAACYERHSHIFLKMRRFRDHLVHKGHVVEALYTGKTDFLISRDFGPFTDMNIWREEEMEPNALGPLKPVLGLLIHNLLWACNDFISEWMKVIETPPDLVPSMYFYSRGYNNSYLLDALRDAQYRLNEGRGLPGTPELPIQVQDQDS